MGASAAIPATFPVQFIERAVFWSGEMGAYVPHLGGVVEFEGRLDEVRLGRAMRLLLDAEPVLGCRFETEGKPPVWQRLDGLDETLLLEVRESDDPSAEAAAFIAAPFDCTVGPQALAALVRGPGSDTLAVKVTHVVMDGGALKETLYLIGDLYRTLSARPGFAPDPNVDGLRHPVTRARFFEKLGAMRQNDLAPQPSDWRLPKLGGKGAGAYVWTAVEPQTFRAAAALGKASGATVNDIVLTAEYGALWRLLGATSGDRTPLMISCELRKHLPPGTKTAFSNISSAWWVSVPPIDGEAFGDSLARVVEATRAWKSRGAGKASAIGIPMVTKLTRNKDLASVGKMLFGKAAADEDPDSGGGGLTNIGVIDDARLDFGPEARVRDAWLLGPVSAMVVILTATTFRDRLHLAVGADYASIGESIAAGVVSETAQEIEEWVASRSAASA